MLYTQENSLKLLLLIIIVLQTPIGLASYALNEFRLTSVTEMQQLCVHILFFNICVTNSSTVGIVCIIYIYSIYISHLFTVAPIIILFIAYAIMLATIIILIALMILCYIYTIYIIIIPGVIIMLCKDNSYIFKHTLHQVNEQRYPKQTSSQCVY